MRNAALLLCLGLAACAGANAKRTQEGVQRHAALPEGARGHVVGQVGREAALVGGFAHVQAFP